MQFVEKLHEGLDEDIDLRALENGFVSSLSLSLSLSLSVRAVIKWLTVSRCITHRYLSLL
jgi:5'-nucleotidase